MVSILEMTKSLQNEIVGFLLFKWHNSTQNHLKGLKRQNMSL